MTFTLEHLSGMWPAVATAAVAGPLVVAGLAKLFTPPEKQAWPITTGPLRAPVGPRLAGAVELAASVAICLLPGRSASIVAVAAYVVLSLAAYLLRGQPCACFGVMRLTAVGRLHMGLNLAAAVIAGVATVAGPASGPLPRVIVMACAGVATLGAVLFADRHDTAGGNAGTSPCDEPVEGVRLYVSASCPACRALEQLITTMEDARREAITKVVVGGGNPAPTEVAGMGVPCAVRLSGAGEPVCDPVSGIGAVKSVIDTIVIRGAAARAR
jgi:hypothetical protein